jgi:hypothetical protein
MPDDRHTIGGNKPPTATETYQPRIDQLLLRFTKIAAAEITEASAAELRDVIGDATKLENEMKAGKAKDKQPANDALKAIETEYAALADDAGQIKGDARKRLDAWMLAEEQRRKAEAEKLRAKEEALRAKAEEAKEAAADNPFAEEVVSDAEYDAAMAAHAAAHAMHRAAAGPSVRGASGARAATLRSYFSVEVIDAAALVAHFAADRDVIAAAKKAADAVARATKGAQAIPGCKIREDRRSA